MLSLAEMHLRSTSLHSALRFQTKFCMYVIYNPVDPLADLRDQALKDDALSNHKVHKIVSVIISPRDMKVDTLA